LRSLEADGLVALSANGVAVTPRGRMLVRIVARVFDRHLTRSAGNAPAIRGSSREAPQTPVTGHRAQARTGG